LQKTNYVQSEPGKILKKNGALRRFGGRPWEYTGHIGFVLQKEKGTNPRPKKNRRTSPAGVSAESPESDLS